MSRCRYAVTGVDCAGSLPARVGLFAPAYRPDILPESSCYVRRGAELQAPAAPGMLKSAVEIPESQNLPANGHELFARSDAPADAGDSLPARRSVPALTEC